MTEELNLCDVSDKLIFDCNNCSRVFRSDEYRIYFNKYLSGSLTRALMMTKIYKKKCPNCGLEMTRFIGPVYIKTHKMYLSTIGGNNNECL